jgi:hypothetical protein
MKGAGGIIACATRMLQFSSVKLIQTLSSNFYSRGFSLSSKTGPSITDIAICFYFVTLERRVLVPVTLCIKEIFSGELDNE